MRTQVPSAFWIDNKDKIHGRDRDYTLEGILHDAASKSVPPLCVFIFYDLPNRDCNAKASNGEISDATAGSAAALREYQHEYVDPFVSVLQMYESVPVVLVIEPDSLGNVISNTGSNGCTAATVANYKDGVAYAVRSIAARAPHVAIYVDAAHGGWVRKRRSNPGLHQPRPNAGSPPWCCRWALSTMRRPSFS
jgi:cellulose 1,4-beta-cellobiosidase